MCSFAFIFVYIHIYICSYIICIRYIGRTLSQKIRWTNGLLEIELYLFYRYLHPHASDYFIMVLNQVWPMYFTSLNINYLLIWLDNSPQTMVTNLFWL